MHEDSSAKYIIVISGTSGAGKTTLVRNQAQTLGEATALFFDDYASTSSYPTDMTAWLGNGANPDQWHTPQMVQDLLTLRSGKSIKHPLTNQVIEPKPFLVVEEPSGKARRELGDLVDFCAFLDIPLEVALARRLLRDLAIPSLSSDPVRSREYVIDFVRQYLELTRDLYRAANRLAAQTCDLLLDGEKPLEVLTQEVVRAIRERQ